MCSKPNTSGSAMLGLCSDSAQQRKEERDDVWAGHTSQQPVGVGGAITSRKSWSVGFRWFGGAARPSGRVLGEGRLGRGGRLRAPRVLSSPLTLPPKAVLG